MQAGMWLVIAGVLDLLAGIIAVKTATDIGQKIEYILLTIEAVTGFILPGIGLWLEGSNGNEGLYRTMEFISAGLNQVAGVLVNAYAVYKNVGWFARGVLDAAIFSAETAVEGAPGAVEEVGMAVVGGAASLLLTGFSYQALAQYNAATGELDREQQLEQQQGVSGWCAAFGNGKCTQLPAN